MSKQGMARLTRTHTKSRNDAPPVPEPQGKAKHGKEPAKPIISGTSGPEQKVYHKLKGDGSVGDPNFSSAHPDKGLPHHWQRPCPRQHRKRAFRSQTRKNCDPIRT